MGKVSAISVSVIFAFVGLCIGGFFGGTVFEGSNVASGIVGVMCAAIFAFGYYYSRKEKEKCKKCGALWSVRFVGTETLTQSVVSETVKTGTVTDYNVVVECNRDKDRTPRHYGKKDIYETRNYLVGEERLTHRCDKCGDEVSTIRKYKRSA